ncbi:hypothetical protein BLOT_002470 [Blomia tropicalis]|nr:hypothetical protein BLOT_002470 [Blomia tropicalis]
MIELSQYCFFILIFFITRFDTISTTKIIFANTTDVCRDTLVQTNTGPISGLIVTRNGINVTCYLGIPYAEAPIGNRRFVDPSPIKSWKKTYRAVHQPPICYQRDWKEGFKPTSYEIVRELVKMDSSVLNYYETHKSEDCLYLSIFTRTGADLSMKNRTVLVWIHGGAFISGTSSFPFQDYPSLIANDPNLVVVAINYRLNVFGFITSGDKLLSGNYGLKDQIVALQWVKENIGAFGGNSSNVVLWGQSAGAVAIGYHTMMENSGDKLFNRAIMESGDPLLPLTFAKSPYRQSKFIEFIDQLNCTNGNDTTMEWVSNHWINQVLPCLQKSSTKELFEIYEKFSQHAPLAFLPNIEDKSLFTSFDSIWSGIKQKKFSFHGEILIGTNEAEGAQYVKMGPLEPFYSREEIFANFTKVNVQKRLSEFVPENLRSMVEPVLDMLLDGVADQNNSTQLWNRYVQLVGDMVFVCPDFFFLKSYLQHKDEETKGRSERVYYYRFRPKVSKPFDCPTWSTGACHTDELEFIFGIPLLLKSIYPPIEQKLSKSMMSTWLQFAHQGHFTSNETFKQWNPFSISSDGGYLQIDMKMAKMVNGFPGDRCEELSEPFYELLESFDDNQMKVIKLK